MASDRSREGRGKWIAGGLGLAALLYLLTRGGDGFGFGFGAADASSADNSAPRCHVRVDAAGIQVDGERADLASAVERCRVAGGADVTATGAAIVGTITELVRALRAAGVAVWADPAIWDVTAMGGP